MSLLTSLLSGPVPEAAIELAPGRVSAALLSRRGRDVAIAGCAIERLPEGALVASLTGQNVVDRAAVAGALKRACERLGATPARAALVVPDVVAKVSLVRFEQVPARGEDLEQLVRWQVRKSAPFAVDDAVVTFSPGAAADGTGREFVVAMARHATLREYEGVCEDLGMHAGLVDLATFSVANLYLAAADSPAGDWLLVHMRPEYTSLVILRGADVIFFRNRAEGDDETLSDLVHQTAMYYQDRLGGQGFARVLLGGAGRMPGAVDAARGELEQRLGVEVAAVDPTRAATLNGRLANDSDTSDVLAPLVGMALRACREGVGA